MFPVPATSRTAPPPRLPRSTRLGRARAVLAGAGVAALVLSGCHSTTTTGAGAPAGPPATSSSAGAATPSPQPSSSAAAAPSILTPARTSGLNPVSPVTVSVKGGTLSAVSLLTSDGRKVAGALTSDATEWRSTEDLGYGKSYQLSADAVNAGGVKTHKTAVITTLSPPNMTMPYLQRIGGYSLVDGATYGVGIVPSVHFDEPITDKAAAQKTLSITTSPHIATAWYWADDQNVYVRPAGFWPSGTKVTISATVYGKQVSPGLWGQSDTSASFTIGRKQVTYAYDNAPKVDKVVVQDGAGRTLRVMNTSMGKHSTITVNGNVINFYTMYGTYTVLEHDNPAIMSSASYGLPANAPGGYAPEPIYYATKISTDGIYLHQLDTTVWAQNSGVDTSHGCLNLNQANAQWFYQHSLIGDPVVVPNAHNGAPPIQFWQGGAWSVPWSQWVAGGSLNP